MCVVFRVTTFAPCDDTNVFAKTLDLTSGPEFGTDVYHLFALEGGRLVLRRMFDLSDQIPRTVVAVCPQGQGSR